MRFARACGVAAIAALCACSGGGGGSPAPGAPPTVSPTGAPAPPTVNGVRIDTDPFANPTSQHRTEVEPSAFAHGSTIVAAFQTGRFVRAGASDIDVATSFDGGHGWTSGSLPGTTNVVSPGSIVDSVSDPAVGYDAKHGVWLILSLPVVFSGNPVVPSFFVSRSSDGVTWSSPVGAEPSAISADKEWIACDDAPASPHFGTCYAEWDEGGAQGLIHMATTSDGGVTWGPPRQTADNATGIGGQPLVRPDGTVVVPIDDQNEASIFSFTSSDGGATWSASRRISTITDHFEAGGLRSSPLPGAAIDAAGTIYAAWQDCRFHAGCTANDIVFSTTTDGINWSTPARVPLDAVSSGADHFIVGLGADSARPGRVGLAYYSYDASSCTAATCRLSVAFTSSADGGASWSSPAPLAGPIDLGSLAQTTQGVMVGDYLATVYAAGAACSVFVSANPPSGSFDEAAYASVISTASSSALAHLRTTHGPPVPGARSDHGTRPHLPPD